MAFRNKTSVKIIKQLSLLFLTVLLITSNVYSQPQGVNELSDNIAPYENRLNEFNENIFEPSRFESQFDKINHLKPFDSTSVVDSLIITDEYEGLKKYTYTHDSDGNRIFSTYENWKDVQLVYHDRYTYIYDLNGNNTSYLFEREDGDQWINGWKNTYGYDKDGHKNKDLGQNWDGEKWVNQHLNIYAYDSKGKMISSLTEYWDGDDWSFYWRDNYSYDSNNNVILILHELWGGVLDALFPNYFQI